MRNKLFTHILTFFFFLCLNFVFAQEKKDTIFYNKEWKVISNRDEASYYRITYTERNRTRVLDYYINNILQMEGYYSLLESESKEGYFRYFTDSGLVSAEGMFKNNKEEGEWKYYNQGKIRLIEQYSDGKLHGQLQMFYNNGQIKRSELYENDKLISGKCFTKKGIDTTFFEYEISPEFIGGEDKMYEYLSKNIVYPEKARKKNIEGKSVLRFYVDIDGSISEVQILSKQTHPLLNESASETVKKMPKWKPGKVDGVPVKVYYTLPIVFKLD